MSAHVRDTVGFKRENKKKKKNAGLIADDARPSGFWRAVNRNFAWSFRFSMGRRARDRRRSLLLRRRRSNGNSTTWPSYPFSNGRCALDVISLSSPMVTSSRALLESEKKQVHVSQARTGRNALGARIEKSFLSILSQHHGNLMIIV